MKNIRLELRLTKHRIIRRYCGSNRLEDILSHRGNPVAEAFEEVFKNVDPDKHNYRPENLDDLKTAALIDIHGGDLDAIRRAISVVVDRSN
ncbi:MAG: hypothetical protein PF447_08180, partial [Spirochaetaceae bacterium]|nr:hypothetical protein [Spirochaetaceae bacterium]